MAPTPVSERSTIRVPQPEFQQKPKPKRKPKRMDDIPIDPALADECLEWAFEEPDRKANIVKVISLGVMGVVFIVGLKLVQPYLPTSLPYIGGSEVTSSQTASETEQDAEVELALEKETSVDPERWLTGAQTSMSEGKYRLAAAQYRKAVGLMEEAESDPAALLEARLAWANASLLNKDFQRFHSIWTDLERNHPEMADKAKEALLKADLELRRVAADKIEESETTLKSGNVDLAIALADDALDLCLTHHAEGKLLARAHAAVGAAYLEGGNTKVAVSHYAEANRIFPQPDYKSKLSLARSSGPSKANAPSSRRVKVSASSVPEPRVPTGKRVSVRRKAPTNNQKANYVEPAKAQLSKEVPAYQRPLQDKKVRESTNNAPPGYYDN